jgi:hypothetical protein
LAAGAGGVVEAVVSSLKSAAVGGGTLAGSGRGMAASIASSAAVLREDCCAIAELADTVMKVAATAINTRSIPPRLFKQSRIYHTPRVTLPRRGTVWLSFVSLRQEAGLPIPHVCTLRFTANDTQAPLSQPAPPGPLTTN